MKPAPELLLRDLAVYARARLAGGEGRAALHALGADDPALVEVYQLGFREALPSDLAQALKGDDLTEAVVAPACDERGAVVDLLVLHASSSGAMTQTGLCATPRGLLAPRLASACPDLIVTDAFQTLTALWREGRRNVLLLRGPDDARDNALRLAHAGVKSVHLRVQQAEPLAQALRDEGIHVNDVLDAARLELLSHDAKAALATFKAGEALYTVETATEPGTRLEVTVRRGSLIHRDRFDLAVEAQRQRFASSASARTGLPAADIEAHLLQLLDEARRLQDGPAEASVKPARSVDLSPRERDEALALLRRPDLLSQIAADLDSLGWVGEDQAKTLLYLTAISRKLPEPLWAALRATPGAGKSHGLDLIAALTPPEDLLHVSRLTDSALYYQDAQALRHKLLLLDEADALSPEVIVALRVLKTRGALSLSRVQRHPLTGQVSTHFAEARGPVTVLTSTAGQLDGQLLSRCYDLPVDESPEQTARILAAQRRLCATPAACVERERIITRHHNLQRLLECRPVVIPFAERIEFPSSHVQYRREQERFLGLIEASALLHQQQRLRDGQHLVADKRDFELAAALTAPFLGAREGLARHSALLLAALSAAKLATFTIEDVTALQPGRTRYAYRAALHELLDLEYLASPRAGRGRLREYRLLTGQTASTPPLGIRLRAVGELAKVGETTTANFTSRAVSS